ncbi:hypothetical protein EXT47_14250 [Pseudoalteromonas sp. CO342X]|uniref:hypothetical protein n=1 Tax=Pseudoalteromonas sp. CO342X TaxID=1777270 RepID=UPI001023D542|nr:hypothetical protein [Pseudoalteromonas sp. CO342X]RZG14188.1 hypothetical protein EXT47_14250 [Pseudoalteromonas sp. CO342X]
MNFEKVCVSFPLRWGGKVRNSIIKMSFLISLSVLKSKKIIIPIYQNSLNVGVPKGRLAFTYHTISAPEDNRVNWKISPFSDYFTFDKKGYAGFGDSTEERIRLLGLTKPEVEYRAANFINKLKSIKPKYFTPENDDSSVEKKIVIVGQLSNDNVSKLRSIDDHEMYEVGRLLAEKYKAKLVFRPHPLDKSRNTTLPTDFSSLKNLEKSGSIVITHNSGFGILAVTSNVKTVFLAKNEFQDKEYSFKNIEEAFDFSIKEIESFRISNFYNYFGSLVTYDDAALINRMVNSAYEE